MSKTIFITGALRGLGKIRAEDSHLPLPVPIIKNTDGIHLPADFPLTSNHI